MCIMLYHIHVLKASGLILAIRIKGLHYPCKFVIYLLSKTTRILISLMAIRAANTSDTVW